MNDEFDRDDLNDWRRGVNCGCLGGIILCAAVALLFYIVRWGLQWPPQ